jgi:predicted GNAT family N-acyltransferase
MAVAEAYQRQGIGTELMKRAEQLIAVRGLREARLHARCAVHGFYERMGYRVISGVFTEVTIPHIEMSKELRR